eukprot:jgi/Ulvmu1/7500/UM037_0044.1
MYRCLHSFAVFSSCLLPFCVAQESQACSPSQSADILSRVEALEAALLEAQREQPASGAPVSGVKVFPKEHSCSPDDPDKYVLARREPSWHTVADFMAAVATTAPVSAIHLPSEHPAGGLPRHFYVGDVNGMLHLFSPAGSILLEHQTEAASPITAIAEGKHRSNATHVVTGHADGCVRWHLLEHPASTRSQAPISMRQLPATSYCPNATAHEPEASIKLVALGKVYPKQRKLAAVAVTEDNVVLMLRDKGQPPVTASATSAVHHVQLEQRQVRLLTERGFSYVMLHSVNATVRPLTCTGLNETRLIAAAPDLQRPARAYGVSDAGELVGLALAGQNRISACRVRLRREVRTPVATPHMAVLWSSAVTTDSGRLYLFNTSSSAKDRQRSTLQVDLIQLSRSFGVSAQPPLSGSAAVSVDADGHALVQLGDNMVALYHHPTPVQPTSNPFDWIRWARPLMLICMITFGVFQFSRRGSAHRADAAAAQLQPDLMRARKQLLANQRRRM